MRTKSRERDHSENDIMPSKNKVTSDTANNARLKGLGGNVTHGGTTPLGGNGTRLGGLLDSVLARLTAYHDTGPTEATSAKGKTPTKAETTEARSDTANKRINVVDVGVEALGDPLIPHTTDALDYSGTRGS